MKPTPTTLAALAFAIVSGITSFRCIQITEKALQVNAILIEELDRLKEPLESVYDDDWSRLIPGAVVPDPPGRPAIASRSWIQPDGDLAGSRVNNQTYYGGKYLVKPEGVPYCPGPWSPADPSGANNPYLETK